MFCETNFTLHSRDSSAYWRKVNTDIVLDAPTPPSLGIPWNVISQNVGSVENNGMEIEISGNIVRNSNFSYDASLNFSTQYNKVTKLINDMKYEHYIIREGESMRSLYGYLYEGVNMANGFPLYQKADGKIIPFGRLPNSNNTLLLVGTAFATSDITT